MTQPIYRWNGEYFGFISNGRLFDKDSNYLGWIEGSEVWKEDGTYLGELVDGAYVLRKTSMATRAGRASFHSSNTCYTSISRESCCACAPSGIR